MARTYAYSADFDKEVESLFKDAKLRIKRFVKVRLKYYTKLKNQSIFLTYIKMETFIY